MKFGMSIIVRGDAAGPATFDTMAEKAEALGIDTLWASDHLIMPPLTVSS
jgi:alkanesulfonate monooxygenase SsuD/methylene tetrahydromethanopterin reductase-like flavin-dependent oxidoreductase (luciferase family)